MFSSVPLLFVAIAVTCVAQTQGQYADVRCKCVCQKITIANNTESTRRAVYINDTIPPQQCKCENVVMPHVNNEEIKEAEFCPLCECKYESRSTTIIKVVVVITLCVISALVIYMLFLLCLDPLISKRPITAKYQEQNNEDLDESVGVPLPTRPAAGNVLLRVGHKQDKWKRQVQEQRKNIYDKHTILN